MAKTDPKVMSLVESTLRKNPDASVDELFQMAKKLNRAVGRLSRRQFHARYPLQIKRKQRGAKKAKAKKAATTKAKTPRTATSASTATKAATRVRTAVRRARPGKAKKRRAAAPNGVGRDAVRAAFLAFAADLTAADGRRGEFEIIADVDRYVDQAMKATR